MAPRGSTASDHVELAVEKITIPTYPIPPDNRNPMLFWNEWTDIYPYSLQDDLRAERGEREYTAVRLENRFTEVTVLPELGGHIWGARDKAAGREIFYRNRVVKPGLILLRGAWIPTGVEFNFPQGHNVNTLSEVDWHTRRGPDGSATVIVGITERVQRMRWQVAITLHPDRSYIETRATLENRTPLPQRFYYWANAAVHATEGTQYVSSARWINSWVGAKSFPYDENGVNVSFYRNHPHSNDMFSIGDENDFFGGYDYTTDAGLCHVADNAMMPGKKFFTWGTNEGGLIWATMLTDDDGPYIELQAGVYPTQADFGWLMPGEILRLRELWYSVVGTKGFRFANDTVLLNYDLKGGKRPHLALMLNSTKEFRGARALVEADGRALIDERCDIGPGRAAEFDITVRRRGVSENSLVFSVFDSDGRRLAHYRGTKIRKKRTKKDRENAPSVIARARKPRGEMSADELAIAAKRLASSRLYSAAEGCIDRCLGIDDGHAAALRLRALFRIMGGSFKEARELTKKALKRDLNDAETNYYDALALAALGDIERAKLSLGRACKSAEWRSAAETRLAEMAFVEGRPIRATELLRRALAGSSAPARTSALLATALRVGGDYRAARSEVHRLLGAQPTEPLAQAESYLVELADSGRREVKGALDRMICALRDEIQSYLEIACDYMKIGRSADALEIVRIGIRREKRPKGAIARYYVAYLLEMLGRPRAAVRKEFSAADRSSLEHQFPHRVEEEALLRWAVEKRPDDGRASYMLGNLLAARRRPDEALKAWKRAATKLKDFSVVHRNIGRCLWQVKARKREASRHYKRAVRAAPWDHKLYVEADKLFSEIGMDAERRRTRRICGEEVASHGEAAEQMAVMLVDLGRYHEAIDFMYSHTFKPWEGGRVMRAVHIDAFCGAGREAMAKGDLDAAEDYFSRATDFPECLHIGRRKGLSSPEALYMLGLVATKRKSTQLARKLWREATEHASRWGTEETYFAGMAAKKLGQKAKAKRTFEWLLESAEHGHIQWSMDTPAHRSFLKGLALHGLGRKKGAREAWRYALQKDKGHRGARRFIEEVR